ncbi:general transcription and DNA repair factor IIH subunit TFB1-1-like isoform X2 [Malus sylvestris]|uniref:general transcription and DNA repair factor IIH subunit TFB1-1-like isoform X2 n=1 Tax=Malus sylvestris TaxID=3752 RepID=UPI0021ABE743|nr:general transcription and DNA repair factor IIH subunit TFB1-1-like isoform X2 [Malus sylvestris]
MSSSSSSSSRRVVKRAQYKDAARLKNPGIPGVLTMVENKFVFKPNDPTSTQTLDVKFRHIKGHKNTKEGSKQAPLLNLSSSREVKSYIFEFQSFPDLHECRDFVANALSKASEAAKTGPKKDGVTLPDEQLSAAEMELRMKLLQEDSELQKLHMQFVISGVLTESEFWATRKKLLDGESRTKPKQRVGFKNSMILDTKPTSDGRMNKVTFNFTPEIKYQIFALKPAVHQAFLELVPSKMTAKDFWTKYFRAEFLHSTKNAAAIAAEAAEDEELAIFLKEDEILAREARQKLTKGMIIHIFLIMGSFVMVARTSLNYRMSNTGGLYHKTLTDGDLEDPNNVAEALMRSRQEPDESAVQERLDRITRMNEIDDLREPRDHRVAQLCIKDPRDYFDTQQANALKALDDSRIGTEQKKCSMTTEEAYGSLKESISKIKSIGLKNSTVAPEIALMVLNGLTQNISSTKYQLGKNPRESILDSLPNKTKEELLHHSMSIQELLRHFWSTYPITTAYLSTKVGKLKDAMSQIYRQLEEIKESDFRHQVSLLVRPMHQALDAAFQHYESDLQKRAATVARMPNGNA